ncbi:MAG TPA: caspase family protein [Thermoanaerobaculia bacterium]|nr:caspase family protein [Thermoanaerobaculia bacterium]
MIVGISDYNGKLPALDSPVREIEEWRDLLMDNYGFTADNIRLLANDRARRDEIVVRLNWLFKNARPGDQLVFYFAGHGEQLQARDRNSGEILDNMDEALVAYPSAPTDDLQDMALYDNQLFEILVDNQVPQGTNVTFILDCCRGGGFNSRDFPGYPNVMSVMPPVDLRHRSLHRFSDDNRPRRATAQPAEMPVLLNAAGEFNVSVEMTLEGERRSLFSYYALKSLRENPKQTYSDLLSSIFGPIQQRYRLQHPNLRGNTARRTNPFLT